MKTVVYYCGSFSPFHIGHLNIVEKSEAIFGNGNVIIAIGINPEKGIGDDNKIGKELIITEAEYRAELISKQIGRKVIVYTTFLHELVEEKEKEGYNVIIVRGLRNGDDLSYEDNQLRFIKDFTEESKLKDIKVVFIRCDEKYEHISSSAIRNLEKFRPGSGNKYLPNFNI